MDQTLFIFSSSLQAGADQHGLGDRGERRDGEADQLQSQGRQAPGQDSLVPGGQEDRRPRSGIFSLFFWFCFLVGRGNEIDITPLPQQTLLI